MDFWDFFWGTILIYVGLGFLFLLFMVLRDLFRSDSSGVMKALWVIVLVFVPFLATIVYLVVHGAMDDWSGVSARMAQSQQQPVFAVQHDRQVAPPVPQEPPATSPRAGTRVARQSACRRTRAGHAGRTWINRGWRLSRTDCRHALLPSERMPEAVQAQEVPAVVPQVLPIEVLIPGPSQFGRAADF